jgi:hypothetical protein
LARAEEPAATVVVPTTVPPTATAPVSTLTPVQTPTAVTTPGPAATPTTVAATPTPGPVFDVVLPRDILESPAWDPDPRFRTAATQIQQITAYVNGTRCVRLNLVAALNQPGDPVLTIGARGQPSVCRSEGAEVMFTLGPYGPPITGSREYPLRKTMTLRLGESEVLEWWGINPDTGFVAPPDDAAMAENEEAAAGAEGNSGTSLGLLTWAAVAAGATGAGGLAMLARSRLRRPRELRRSR